MPELLAAGLKPVHCRLVLSNLVIVVHPHLIVVHPSLTVQVHCRLVLSNLDGGASTAGHGLTPVARRMHSLTEEKSLLGGDGA